MIHLLFGILAWLIVALVFLTVYQFFIASSRRIKRLHQIPCSECEYFTRSSCLKCTVRPHWAGTELAIDCPDFEYHQDDSPQSLTTSRATFHDPTNNRLYRHRRP